MVSVTVNRKVIDESVADKAVFKSLWKTPKVRHSSGPMILMKALTSSKDNYTPLENKLVACYWDLADTDSYTDLRMGHHINL